MRHTRLGILLVSSGLALPACGVQTDDGSDPAVMAAPSNLIVPPKADPIFLPPISVRFISIASHCNNMTEADAQTYIKRLNEAGTTSPGWGLNFAFYRLDVFPLPHDDPQDISTWDDIKPLWQGLGMASSQGDVVVDYMNRHYPGGAGADDDHQPYLMRWLQQFKKKLMPGQLIAFQGCGSGVDSALIFESSNLVHEVGHYFGLSHTFALTPDCSVWDLVYGARGKGKFNAYFGSKGDCLDFTAANPDVPLERIDPRTGGSGHPDGLQGGWKGGLLIQHPRCPTCTDDLDSPINSSVERYVMGDTQIAGYGRMLNGHESVNALTYVSTSNGAPNTSLEWRSFYSPAQIEIQRVFVADNQWVLTQGKPVAVNTPVKSCAYIDVNEGLPRDGSFFSCDGRFRLYLQADGNLVLSQKASNGEFKTALWSTGSLTYPVDTTGITLIMQGDGNLVVYDGNQVPLWSSRTDGNPGAYVRLSDAGDLQVRTANSVLWHTNTGGH